MSGVGRAFKYYYDLMSQPSRAMWIALQMSKTPYEDCPIAIRKGEHMQEDFKKINRFQKMPCIVDGDFHLSESIAILRYLDGKKQISPDLYPTDLKTRARVDEFLEWHHLTLRMNCSWYFWRVWRDPITGKPAPSEKERATLLANMERTLDDVENIWLAKTPFLTGPKMTIADIFGACEVEQTRLPKYNVAEKYPKIAEWLKQVRENSNPYYDQAHKYVYIKSGAKL